MKRIKKNTKYIGFFLCLRESELHTVAGKNGENKSFEANQHTIDKRWHGPMNFYTLDFHITLNLIYHVHITQWNHKAKQMQTRKLFLIVDRAEYKSIHPFTPCWVMLGVFFLFSSIKNWLNTMDCAKQPLEPVFIITIILWA